MHAVLLLEAVSCPAGRGYRMRLRALNLLDTGPVSARRAPCRAAHPQPSPMSALRPALAVRSLEFVRPFRRPLGAVLALALMLAVLSAIDPLVMKYLFDQLARPDGAHGFAIAIAAMLGIELLRAVLQWCLGIRSWDVRLGVEYTLRDRVMGKLNTLPLAFHEREGVGGTMNRINQGITGYVTAFSDLAFNLLPTILYLSLSVVAMFRLDWRLAVVVIVFTPLPGLIGARAAPEQISVSAAWSSGGARSTAGSTRCWPG